MVTPIVASTENKPKDSSSRALRRTVFFTLTLLATSGFFALFPQGETAFAETGVPTHWTAILPPVIAILVALFYRSLIAALTAAFLTGSVLAFGFSIHTLPSAVNEFVIGNLQARFNIYIFGFLFVLVGLIHVIGRNGGILGAIKQIERLVRGPRSAKLAVGLAGIVVFFDDYSNTVVVGTTMRPLADRWKISREKLAYLVDSTTAPVAGLAIISTWIAFEVSLFQGVAEQLGLDFGGYDLFLTILPLRFYCLATLVFVVLTSAMNRDFGPMLRAERRSATTGELTAIGSRPLVAQNSTVDLGNRQPAHWINAVLPLAVVIVGAFGGIIFYGYLLLPDTGVAFSVFSSTDLRRAFGAVSAAYETGGVMKVLFLAAVAGSLVAILLSIGRGLLTWKEALGCYVKTLRFLGMAIFILVMAWSMKSICGVALNTDLYLLSIVGDQIPSALVPLVTFLLAAGMSFALGTSWGTMGILIPILLPFAHAISAAEDSGPVIFLLTAAAILDGAIFGDHCSPISDTTVLSSLSTGCDHIDHVNTQLVYALITMVGAASLGYLAVGFGAVSAVFYLGFPLISVVFLLLVGRSPLIPSQEPMTP
jgi:Na+/H+ antiporter NhaC